MASRKGHSKLILENYLQRRSTSWLFFKSYIKEYANLLLYEDGSVVIEFKGDKERSVKYRYDMETCVNVNLRIEMDQARANWPCDIDPESCFILSDSNEDKILYLIAENSRIAQQWTWKLRQYLKATKTADKKNGEFSINNLIDVFNVLTEDPSITSSSLSWKFLGRNLGLGNNTLQKIEDFYDTPEDRLYNCLSKWIRRYDQIDEKGGPTYLTLVEALRKMKDIDKSIAERVLAKFSDDHTSHEQNIERSPSSSPCLLTASLDIASQPLNINDNKDDKLQAVSQNDAERSRTWTCAGCSASEYSQALANSQKFGTMTDLFEAVSFKMHRSNRFLAEIAFLSNKKLSCLVTIDNKTPVNLMYHKCFVARGRVSGYHGFDQSIPTKSQKSYSFEKYTSLSLDGCAAMILFSTNTSESTRCYFIVAFRNYSFKLSKNKAVLLILDGPQAMAKMSNSLCFGTIMRNEDPKPQIDGCYKGDDYESTYISASLDGKPEAKKEFRHINFSISLIDNYRSQIKVKVSHPELG